MNPCPYCLEPLTTEDLHEVHETCLDAFLSKDARHPEELQDVVRKRLKGELS